ncbi:uncharacterized protein LOC62_02G003298 [Vanrija pseudolonga]|uniref:Uncharacterized protein n=1 Tax=Vanrija pseudolonga TaxID=143232 RepID=A0AAF1BH57_9TREE|nr:hypothetical protein LOC62_02G003298 [Vanrija pseudolonga]
MPAPTALTTSRRRLSTPPVPPNSPTESTRTYREWQSALVALRAARLAAAHAARDEATSLADVEALRAQLTQKTAEKTTAIAAKNRAIEEMREAIVTEALAVPGEILLPVLAAQRAEAIWRVETAIVNASVVAAAEGEAHRAYTSMRDVRDSMLPTWSGARAFVAVAEQIARDCEARYNAALAADEPWGDSVTYVEEEVDGGSSASSPEDEAFVLV